MDNIVVGYLFKSISFYDSNRYMGKFHCNSIPHSLIYRSLFIWQFNVIWIFSNDKFCFQYKYNIYISFLLVYQYYCRRKIWTIFCHLLTDILFMTFCNRLSVRAIFYSMLFYIPLVGNDISLWELYLYCMRHKRLFNVKWFNRSK